MKTIITTAAFAFLSMAATQALAQEDGPMKVAVSYADLDLSRANGRAVLEQRIERAIDRVCPEQPLPTELSKQHTYKACRTAAWAGAKEQLAQIYDGRQFAEAAVSIRGPRH